MQENSVLKAHTSSFNIRGVEHACTNRTRFQVTGNYLDNTDDMRSGILDSNIQNYILPLQYSSLPRLEAYPNLWRFALQKEEN